ncbi:MAG: hypothetical protein IPM82_17115 [Saprospiraceae bacterium]|nr:hypothetical protein [Saprospiraceae bacterium]
MNISFLGQGFQDESRPVGGLLVQYLQEEGFHSFTGISAFASKLGINGLSRFVDIAKSNFQQLNIVVGIARGGTSKEALDELVKMDVNSFVFHLEKAAIFHPKYTS